MEKHPFDVIDSDLASLQTSVRNQIVERFAEGLEVVSAAKGKVVARQKIHGKPTEDTIGTYGAVRRHLKGKLKPVRFHVLHRASEASADDLMVP